MLRAIFLFVQVQIYGPIIFDCPCTDRGRTPDSYIRFAAQHAPVCLDRYRSDPIQGTLKINIATEACR